MAPQPSSPHLHCSLQSMAKPMMLLACHKPALTGELEPWGSWGHLLTTAPSLRWMLGAALWMAWG